MKKDLIGQAIILISTGLVCSLTTSQGWLITLVSLLTLWQLGSAVELFHQHQYKQRFIFVWLLPILLLSLPVMIYWLKSWMVLILGTSLIVYFLITARDTLTVYRRPRSFWDL